MGTAIRASLVIAILSSCGSIASSAWAIAQGEPAVWNEREVVISYKGITTRYSCDGLRDKLQRVMQDLGARAQPRFTEYGCAARTGRADPFPSIKVEFATLEPATSPAALAGAWKSVDLAAMGKLDGGDCELLQVIVEQILPLFSVRNVQSTPLCVPNGQSTITTFRLDVFVVAAAP